MGWACAPRLHVEALPPSVMIFGGDRVQARSRVGWVSLLCPQLSLRRLGTQREGGHVQTRKWALPGTRMRWYRDLGRSVSSTVRNKHPVS